MIKKLTLPFLKNEKCLILAYDHGLGKSPEVLKFQSKNPKYIFELAKNIQATGIILNKGIAEIYSQSNYKTPLIVKLNSKLEKTNEPILTCSVKYAYTLGAKAVGYTIYFGSEYESEQIEIASSIIEEAHSLKMAAIIWAYIVDDAWNYIQDFNYLSFALRQVYEIGADMVKLPTIDNLSDLQKLNEITPNLPVAIRGGNSIDNEELLTWAKRTMENTADGLIIGRNIWQKENAVEIGKKIHNIIFNKNI